jgi:hypothetical protein
MFDQDWIAQMLCIGATAFLIMAWLPSFYSTGLWLPLATFVTFATALLSRNILIILQGAGLVLLGYFGSRHEISGLGNRMSLAFVLLGALLISNVVRPPTIVLLTASGADGKRLLQSLRRAFLPYRVAVMLAPSVVPFNAFGPDSASNLRMFEPAGWRSTLYLLCGLARGIVVDARKPSEHVAFEIALTSDRALVQKTILVTNEPRFSSTAHRACTEPELITFVRSIWGPIALPALWFLVAGIVGAYAIWFEILPRFFS